MVGPIQLVKNVKHNLSVPIVITEIRKEDSEEAIQYERKVYRLVGINIGLFICLLALFKYLFQYRFGYSYWKSLDYITDELPFIAILLGSYIINIIFVSIFYAYIEMIKDDRSISSKNTKWILIGLYLGSVFSFLLLMSFVCSMFPTNILVYAAIIMVALVCIVKYLSLYLYKRYGYQLTYYQIFIYTELISVMMIMLFRGGVTMMVTNILCIIVDIIMLMADFQGIEHTKEKLNAGYDNNLEIDIMPYDIALSMTASITALYLEISYLLFSGYDD